MTEQINPGEMPTNAAQSATPQNDTPEQVEGEQFDAKRAMALIEKLRAEVKELKPKAKQADELAQAQKAKDEAEMTAVQKAEKRAAEAEARAQKLERERLQETIAKNVGLPDYLADRIRGETAEEMEADAKVILEKLPKQPKPTPGIAASNPGANGQPGETREQKKARLMGTPGDIWAGGGINWPKE